MKTYLVTGGAGFIGSNFILHMLGRKSDISIINFDKLTYAGNLQNLAAVAGDKRYSFVKGDICDAMAVTEVFAARDIDYIVNFAAESHVDKSIAEPLIFEKTNVGGTLNLLNCALAAWQKNGGLESGRRFLQISTDEVYGSLGAEGFFTEVTPLSPHSPYSASKAAADLFVQSYKDTYGLPVNITRCSNNYGPRQFEEKLIPLMIKNALRHESLPIYGDGNQVRDWIYVADNCAAIETVLHNAPAGEVYNIGGHNERTNLEIVRDIIAYISKNADSAVTESLIEHVEDRKGHDRRYAVNCDKLKRDLCWEQKCPFDEGMKTTIEWYVKAWKKLS